jgi:hypothetical protein
VSRLSQLFPTQIRLTYGCPDRIVIRGYYDALQREDNIRHFFKDVVGLPVVDSDALASRTIAYRKWLDAFVREQRIDRVVAPKRERKEDFVQPYYRRLGDREGIACVLTSMETNKTFVSYTPRYETPDPTYRIIRCCRKLFQHVYFYVFDRVMGPMSVCVGTYLPFAIQIYLNGHEFVARRLAGQGVRFRKYDNALLWVDDVSALRAAVDALTSDVIEQRCRYWASRLAPRFTPYERRAAHLPGYAFSIAQLEYAQDIVFSQKAHIDATMRRLAEQGAFLGGADRTVTVFGRHINRRYQGKLMTVLEAADQGHPSLRSYYKSSFVKLYTKPDERHRDRCLRVEVCLNNPDHLATRRGLQHLPELLGKMAATTDRYLDLHAELLDSAVDAGDLARLSEPTLRGKRRIPGIRLHDDRLLRLLEVLLQPAGMIADWTIADLHTRVLERYHLTADEYRRSQLRYDLSKIRAKNMIERVGSSRRYRVTPTGLRLGVLLVKVRIRLLGPLFTVAATHRRHTHPPATPIEAATRRVDAALDDLFAAVALKAA